MLSPQSRLRRQTQEIPQTSKFFQYYLSLFGNSGILRSRVVVNL